MDELVEELKALTKRQHAPPYLDDKDWDVIVTTGSQDALTKVI